MGLIKQLGILFLMSMGCFILVLSQGCGQRNWLLLERYASSIEEPIQGSQGEISGEQSTEATTDQTENQSEETETQQENSTPENSEEISGGQSDATSTGNHALTTPSNPDTQDASETNAAQSTGAESTGTDTTQTTGTDRSGSTETDATDGTDTDATDDTETDATDGTDTDATDDTETDATDNTETDATQSTGTNADVDTDATDNTETDTDSDTDASEQDTDEEADASEDETAQTHVPLWPGYGGYTFNGQASSQGPSDISSATASLIGVVRIRGTIAVSEDGSIYFGNHQGFYAYTSSLSLKWSITDAEYTSPVIDNYGRIYVGNDQERLLMIEDNGNSYTSISYQVTGALSAPLVIDANDTLYCGSEAGVVYAFDPPQDGQDWAPKWSVEPNSGSKISTAFAVIGDSVYGGNQHQVFSISQSSGEIEWAYALSQDQARACSAIVGNTDFILFVDYSDTFSPLISLHRTTGQQLWAKQIDTLENPFMTPAIDEDGRIFTCAVTQSGMAQLYMLSAGDGSNLRTPVDLDPTFQNVSIPTIDSSGTVFVRTVHEDEDHMLLFSCSFSESDVTVLQRRIDAATLAFTQYVADPLVIVNGALWFHDYTQVVRIQ